MKVCMYMARTKRDEYFDMALQDPRRKDPMLLRDPNFTNFIEAAVLSFREALQAAYDRGRYDALHSSEEGKAQTVGKTCLTIKEMGKHLGVSNNMAYQLVHSKGFPVLRIGRRMLIPVKELDIWLASVQSANEKIIT
jgi:excisionase family DNA binding protein